MADSSSSVLPLVLLAFLSPMSSLVSGRVLELGFPLLIPAVERVGGWWVERCLSSRWIPEFYFQFGLGIGLVT